MAKISVLAFIIITYNLVRNSTLKTYAQEVNTNLKDESLEPVVQAWNYFKNIPEEYKPNNNEVIKESQKKLSILCWTHVLRVETDKNGTVLNKVSSYKITFKIPEKIPQNFVQKEGVIIPTIEDVETDHSNIKKTKIVTCTRRNKRENYYKKDDDSQSQEEEEISAIEIVEKKLDEKVETTTSFPNSFRKNQSEIEEIVGQILKESKGFRKMLLDMPTTDNSVFTQESTIYINAPIHHTTTNIILNADNTNQDTESSELMKKIIKDSFPENLSIVGTRKTNEDEITSEETTTIISSPTTVDSTTENDISAEKNITEIKEAVKEVLINELQRISSSTSLESTTEKTELDLEDLLQILDVSDENCHSTVKNDFESTENNPHRKINNEESEEEVYNTETVYSTTNIPELSTIKPSRKSNKLKMINDLVRKLLNQLSEETTTQNIREEDETNNDFQTTSTLLSITDLSFEREENESEEKWIEDSTLDKPFAAERKHLKKFSDYSEEITTTELNKNEAKRNEIEEMNRVTSTEETTNYLKSSEEENYSDEDPNVRSFPIRIITQNDSDESNKTCTYIGKYIKYGICPENEETIPRIKKLKLPEETEYKYIEKMPENISEYFLVGDGMQCYLFENRKLDSDCFEDQFLFELEVSENEETPSNKIQLEKDTCVEMTNSELYEDCRDEDQLKALKNTFSSDFIIVQACNRCAFFPKSSEVHCDLNSNEYPNKFEYNEEFGVYLKKEDNQLKIYDNNFIVRIQCEKEIKYCARISKDILKLKAGLKVKLNLTFNEESLPEDVNITNIDYITYDKKTLFASNEDSLYVFKVIEYFSCSNDEAINLIPKEQFCNYFHHIYFPQSNCEETNIYKTTTESLKSITESLRSSSPISESTTEIASTTTEFIPLLQYESVNGKKYCLKMNENIKFEKVNCPENSETLPKLLHPKELKIVCRQMMKNRKEAFDVLKTLNIIQ